MVIGSVEELLDGDVVNSCIGFGEDMEVCGWEWNMERRRVL